MCVLLLVGFSEPIIPIDLRVSARLLFRIDVRSLVSLEDALAWSLLLILAVLLVVVGFDSVCFLIVFFMTLSWSMTSILPLGIMLSS